MATTQQECYCTPSHPHGSHYYSITALLPTVWATQTSTPSSPYPSITDSSSDEIYVPTPCRQTKPAKARREGASSEFTQSRWPQSVLPSSRSTWTTSRETFPLPYAPSPPPKCWPTPPPLDSRRCRKANANEDPTSDWQLAGLAKSPLLPHTHWLKAANLAKARQHRSFFSLLSWPAKR